jgi:antitoxin component YwqK of YwqJK toxin-antitoxin module
MDTVNLSQVSQANFTSKPEVQKETPKEPEQKKNGKKLLAAGAAATATIAIAALAIKKGKLPKGTQVADLKFNKGIAMKGDELFTGVAEHTNKKGDKFLLEYNDGVLQKSMKNINPETGAVSLEKGNFIKHYSEVNGTRRVSISKDIINDVQRSNCEISKGSVIRTKITGGKETFYFHDGKLSQCTLSDGTIREWYDNGQMKRECLPDRTLRLWYDNGQMERENLPDGTLRLWHNNGQIVSECKKIMLEDHIKPVEFKITYDESGQIKSLGNKTDDRIIVYHYDEGYSCIASGYNKESLKEIFDKLSIEMPDIKFD